ncbi:MAG: methyltransferase domain-containing protein [Chloroflexi bacterium]|nr:methyltransferase domain-containing protein [Chloroflexota bacterium]
MTHVPSPADLSSPPASSASHTYYVTVATGLEFIAEDEIRERFPSAQAQRSRGKVLFTVDAPPAPLLAIRSAEHLYAFVARISGIPSDRSGLTRLEQVPLEVDWEPALAVWRRFFPDAPEPPAFRVTAQRSGQHAYQSPDVAAALGTGLVRRFGWPVRLKDFDLEVMAYLQGDELTLGITLTPGGLYRRERVAWGRTALKGSIAYAMVRLARVRPGDLLVDPMCGVGTIPIEAALAWPGLRCWGGDRSWGAVSRAALNARHVGAPVHLFHWNVHRLPLDDDSVDAIVCDMPFGRRVGSHELNRRIYPPALREMARVLRPGGQAVLLTLERKLMEQIVRGDPIWRSEAVYPVNVGGLEARLYRLRKRPSA